ncbi:NUDIX hydrolase [Desulfobacterales bacterium HSG17]|nr:NUDIX hydrolase [Desulfobacterales bacterium HSG17]
MQKTKNIMTSFIDKLWQMAYIAAYRIMLCIWYIFKLQSRGACVAVWHDNRVVLIKNSYKPHYSLPGGNVEKGELPLDAALRELAEEVGIRVNKKQLGFIGDFENPLEYKKDVISLFELKLEEKPVLKVDNREVIWAGLKTPQEAVDMGVFPVLRPYFIGKFKY